MNKFLTYGAAVALIMAAAAGHTHAQEWQAHVDEKAKVKYSLPKDWKVEVKDEGSGGRDFAAVSPDEKMLFFLASEDPGFRTDDPALLDRFYKVSLQQFLDRKKIGVKNNSLTIQAGANNNMKGATFQFTALTGGAEYKVSGFVGFYKDRSLICLLGYDPTMEGYLVQAFTGNVLQRLSGFEAAPRPAIDNNTPNGAPIVRHELWSIVMSKDLDYMQTYNMVDSVADNDWIKQKWNEGYYITSVASGDRRWLVVMSKDTGITSQSFSNESTEFPADFIKEKWGKGYEITSVASEKGKWVVLMSKGAGLAEQTYFWGFPFPADKVIEKQAEGYAITYLASDHQRWLVVMSKGSRYGDQLYYWNEKEAALSDWINQKWSQGYYITSMASLNKMKCAVVSKGPAYTKQFFWTTDNLPEKWIQEIWKTNYRLTSVF